MKEDGSDEQKWKREMEHMRFDFKLSRKVDFKIHNVDPTKKRTVGGGNGEEKGGQKRMKGSNTSQGNVNRVNHQDNLLLRVISSVSCYFWGVFETTQNTVF